MDIKKLDKKTISDAWFLIQESSLWLNNQGMDHWIDNYNEEGVRHKLEAGEVYCIYEQDIPVATVSISKIAPDYYDEEDLIQFNQEYNEKAIWVSALCVSPKYHGKGYAKALLRFVEKYSIENGYKSLRFDARKRHTKLIEFYNKQGYSEIGLMNDDGEKFSLFEKIV